MPDQIPNVDFDDFNIDDLNMDEIPEQTVLEAGSEAKLELLTARLKVSGAGNLYVALFLGIVSDDPESDYRPISHNALAVPKASDDRSTYNNKARRLDEFCTAFGLNNKELLSYIKSAVSQLQSGEAEAEVWEDAKGAEGWAIVGVDTYEGEEKNTVKRFVVGS